MSTIGHRVGATCVIVAGLVLVTASIASAQTATSGRAPTDPKATITHDVHYATVEGFDLTLDVYQPTEPAPGPVPAIVMVHGGAWATGHASDMVQQGQLFAQEGWVAFSINYRTTDEVGTSGEAWPAEVDDVQRAIRWVGANAATYGADPTRVAVLGASAGAHLASLVAAIGTATDARGVAPDPPDPNPPVKLRAVASWSAPIVLDQMAPPTSGGPPSACGSNQTCVMFWTTPWVQRFLGCEPAACAATYTAASPVARVSPATIPVWIANSTKELVPLNQAEQFADALEKAKVDHHLRVVDGNDHAYSYTDEVWNEMIPWLAAKLGVATPKAIDFPARDTSLSAPELLVLAIGATLILGVIVAAIRERRKRPTETP